MKSSQSIFLILTILIGRLLITFFHEAGHGIAAAAFTRKEITLFFGSYGKTNKNLKFKIGRFTFYIKYNIFKWNGGMCQADQTTMSLYEYILFIVAGPVLPFFIAVIYFYIAKNYGSENMYVTSVFFLIGTTLSLIFNLIPKKKPIKLIGGDITYNDGNLLMTAIKYRHFRKEYTLAIKHYNEKEYSTAAEYFKLLIKNGMKEEHIYRLMVHSYLLAKEFDNAKTHIASFTEQFQLSALDLINFGYYYSNSEDHDTALDYYQKALKIDESWHAHNNIGYTLNIKERYKDAIFHFDKAVALDPKHAYSYNNRGIAKIKLGDTEAGFKDMEMSYSIDPENSYYYKNMGIYHFDRKEYSKALEYFETALQKDASTHKIKEDIESTLRLLQLESN